MAGSFVRWFEGQTGVAGTDIHLEPAFAIAVCRIEVASANAAVDPVAAIRNNGSPLSRVATKSMLSRLRKYVLRAVRNFRERGRPDGRASGNPRRHRRKAARRTDQVGPVGSGGSSRRCRTKVRRCHRRFWTVRARSATEDAPTGIERPSTDGGVAAT
jgi:hypothetical protein